MATDNWTDRNYKRIHSSLRTNTGEEVRKEEQQNKEQQNKEQQNKEQQNKEQQNKEGQNKEQQQSLKKKENKDGKLSQKQAIKNDMMKFVWE